MSGAQYEGYLMKQSMWLREWRRRYFRLVGNTLYWSKTPNDEPHGSVNLRDCLTVKSAEDRIGKPNSLELSTRSDEVYYLIADTSAEKDAWIGAIGKAIVQSSMSFMKSGQAQNYDDDDDEE